MRLAGADEPMKSKPLDKATVEDMVLRFAQDKPELGQFSVAAALSEQGHSVSASTVRNIWRRHGLETSYQRLLAKSRAAQGAPAAALSQDEQTLLKRARFNRKLQAEASKTEGTVSDLRREKILLAAAQAFAANGYAEASLQQICAAAGIQAASMYYHFDSKEVLFATVHALGMAQINAELDRTAARYDDPWQRLEETSATALRFQLDRSALAIVVRVDSGTRLPAKLQKKINADREAYEERFRRQIDALPLHPQADKSLLRLSFLGALNWTAVWYQPGRLSPEDIGRELVRITFGYGFQRGTANASGTPATPAASRGRTGQAQ